MPGRPSSQRARRVYLALILPVVSMFALAACSDSGTGPEEETPVATTVVVSPTSKTLSSTGATTQLNASVRDQNGQTMSGQTVTWGSDAESVATVSASGLVTAVGDGSATITATSSSHQGNATITVAIRGNLRVTTETAGDPGALDANGYLLNIGSSSASLSTNGMKVIDGLPLGEVTVELTSVATNCQITSEATATVTITESETAEASFTLACETLAGMYRWATTVGGELVGTAMAADGTIYAATNADQAMLFALAPDGTVAWSFTADEYIAGPPSVAPDGTIHFGSGAGTLYALNPDGTAKWTYTVGGVFGVSGTPVVGPDGTVYVSDDNFLDPPTIHAVSSAGTQLWTYSDGGSAGYRMALGAGGTLYAAKDETANGRLVALDASDGSVDWTYELDGSGSAPAIAEDGTIYVGGTGSFDSGSGIFTTDGKLYALNPDGSLAWTYQTGGAVFTSPALAADGTIYVTSGGSQDDTDPVGTVYALNSDGSEAWRDPLSGCPAEYGGVTVGADGTLYVPVGGCVFGGVGILHAYDAAGSELWQFEVNGEFKVIKGSSPIAADGTAYVASQLTGEIYAVKTGSMGLAASAWPKPGRDNQNSGAAAGGGG